MGPATPGVSRARAAANPPDTSTSSLLVTHEAIAPTSSLADQQNKSSGNDQQSKQNTDDERNNRMPIGPDFTSSAQGSNWHDGLVESSENLERVLASGYVLRVVCINNAS